MSRRALLPFFVSFFVVFVPELAHASPSARLVYLRGKGTESCPSENQLREAVQTRLGYDPFFGFAADTMLAEVSAEKGGYAAQLKLVDAENNVRGDRTLHVKGPCEELMTAMALTMSIVIDPMSVTRNGPPEDAPPQEKAVDEQSVADASPSEESPTDGPAETPRPTPPPPAPKFRFFAGLGPVATLGTAPDWAVGGSLFVEAQYRLVFAAIEGRADLPSSASAGDLGRVKSSLLASTLALGIRKDALIAGAVASVGTIQATSTDVSVSKDDSAPYVGVGIRIGAGLPLSERVEVRAHGELLATLVRNGLAINGQEVFHYPAVAGNVGLRLALRFP